MLCVGTISEEKCRQKQLREKGNEEATENVSSYFKNLGYEGEVEGRRKGWNKGRKRRIRGRILFFR